VQNFSENLVMLLFVGAYSLVSAAGAPVAQTVIGFGTVLVLAVVAISAMRLHRRSSFS
jgi:hypothetical protein